MCEVKPIPPGTHFPKSVDDWSELKKGDQIIVVANSNNHRYPMNEVLTMKRDGVKHGDYNDGQNPYKMMDAVCECAGNWLRISDIVIVGTLVYTLDEMKEQLEKTNSQIESLEQRIKICKEIGSDVYNEDDFNIYMALDVLDGTGTRQEKVKALSLLLKKDC